MFLYEQMRFSKNAPGATHKGISVKRRLRNDMCLGGPNKNLKAKTAKYNWCLYVLLTGQRATGYSGVPRRLFCLSTKHTKNNCILMCFGFSAKSKNKTNSQTIVFTVYLVPRGAPAGVSTNRAGPSGRGRGGETLP